MTSANPNSNRDYCHNPAGQLFFWGSHGCDRGQHDDLIHRCGVFDSEGPCCEYDEAAEPDRRIRYWLESEADDDEEPTGYWGNWRAFGQGLWLT